MSKIDVRLPDAIQEQLALPRCADIRLPQARLPQIRLPTGGASKASPT
jgi:hypothetical protein